MYAFICLLHAGVLFKWAPEPWLVGLLCLRLSTLCVLERQPQCRPAAAGSAGADGVCLFCCVPSRGQVAARRTSFLFLATEVVCLLWAIAAFVLAEYSWAFVLAEMALFLAVVTAYHLTAHPEAMFIVTAYIIGAGCPLGAYAMYTHNIAGEAAGS